MGKHSEPRRAAPRSALQTLQNAALPAALLVVVGVIAFASPVLRDTEATRAIDGSVSSAEIPPSVSPSRSKAAPAPTQAPDRKKTTQAAELAYQAGIVQGLRLERRPEPVISEGFVRVRRSALVSTSFAVASYNVLGYGHTTRGGNKTGWADGRTRMRWATDQLRGHDISVVGFQEFQTEQFYTFNSVAGGEYAVYPGAAGGRDGVQNSIAWRRSEWTVVEANTLSVPYFDGGRMPMPYVLLRNLTTGQQVWFANFHNPADAHGPAQGARDAAMAMEVNLFNQLRADTGLPVVSTGDFNEREVVMCRFATGAAMHSADGGYADAAGCHPPAQMRWVDWVFGTDDITFSNYLGDRSAYVARTSDHPLIRADALISPPFDAAKCLARTKTSTFVFCPPAG